MSTVKSVRIRYEWQVPEIIPKHLVTDDLVAANNLNHRLKHALSLFRLLKRSEPDLSDLGCAIIAGAIDDLGTVFKPTQPAEFVSTSIRQSPVPLRLVGSPPKKKRKDCDIIPATGLDNRGKGRESKRSSRCNKEINHEG
ncbi:MAG: hypothetical protein AB7J13_07365 [Pyrinomonadaceae bacterium]